MPEQGQVQSKMSPEEARQRRIERKMRAVSDPGSMVIAPRSSEGHSWSRSSSISTGGSTASRPGRSPSSPRGGKERLRSGGKAEYRL